MYMLLLCKGVEPRLEADVSPGLPDVCRSWNIQFNVQLQQVCFFCHLTDLKVVAFHNKVLEAGVQLGEEYRPVIYAFARPAV